MSRRLCLITGASSGIGEALAREFADHGWDLALVARRKERLEALAEELKAKHGVDSLIIPADLADPGAPGAVVKAVEDAGRQVDGLVNNAGFGLAGTFLNTTWEQQAEFLQVMVTAYAELVHRVLPGMAERGFGRILNVASVAGLSPGAKGHTLYAGAKSLLIKFSQSLHLEAEGKGVHVTALCPGFTYSEFHDVNETRSTVSKLPAYWWLTAEDVARAGYDALSRNVTIRVPGAWYKVLVTLFRLMPDPVAEMFMRRQSKSFRSETPQGASAD